MDYLSLRTFARPYLLYHGPCKDIEPPAKTYLLLLCAKQIVYQYGPG